MVPASGESFLVKRSLFSTLAWHFEAPSRRTSRRDFLKMAAATLVLPGLARAQSRSQRVLVVGAGLAGLACAHELHKAGFAVEVLEARHRLGGRVLSLGDFTPGVPIEGGAELIGSNHPLWNAYARQFGLPLLELPESDLLPRLFFQGQALPQARLGGLYEELEEALLRLVPLAKTIPPATPWQADLALDEQTLESWANQQKLSPDCLRLLQLDLQCNLMAPLSRLSLLGYLAAIAGGQYESYFKDSETHRCQSGNQSLASALASPLTVRTGAAVRHLRIEDRHCEVQLADGQRLRADHLVLTVPPSAWALLQSDPPLPQLRPQMGPGYKFLCSLNSPLPESSDTLAEGPLPFTWDGLQVGHSLIGFAGGPYADPDPQTQPLLAELQTRFPDLPDRLRDSRLLNWSRDPWAGAAYSSPAPGDIPQLGPLWDRPWHGRLHFAGEHTCFAFPGFMEGALQSGVKIASRLANETE